MPFTKLSCASTHPPAWNPTLTPFLFLSIHITIIMKCKEMVLWGNQSESVFKLPLVSQVRECEVSGRRVRMIAEKHKTQKIDMRLKIASDFQTVFFSFTLRFFLSYFSWCFDFGEFVSSRSQRLLLYLVLMMVTWAPLAPNKAGSWTRVTTLQVPV